MLDKSVPRWREKLSSIGPDGSLMGNHLGAPGAACWHWCRTLLLLRGQWRILPALVVIPMLSLRPSQVECLQAIQTIAVESHKKVKKSRAISDSKRRPCMNLRKLGMLDKQGLIVQKVQPLWLEKYKPSFFSWKACVWRVGLRTKVSSNCVICTRDKGARSSISWS